MPDSHWRNSCSLLAHSDRQFKRLLAHAESLHRLQRELWPHLPANLRSRVRVANIKGDTLIIQAESPVWANRARFHAPDLLEVRVQGEGKHPRLGAVKVTVRAPEGHSRRLPRPPAAALSERSAACVLGVAAGISDPRLRTALARLARHVRARE